MNKFQTTNKPFLLFNIIYYIKKNNVHCYKCLFDEFDPKESKI